jgi:hypothetical protein
MSVREERFVARFAAIETQKAEVLRRVEALSADDRVKRAKTDDWSPLQVVYHLMRAEELLPASAEPIAMPFNPKLQIGCIILKAAIPIPSKAKEEPRNDVDLAEITTRWGVAREKLAQSLATPAGTRVADHPVFGGIDIDGYLKMLEAHTTYHLKRWP